MYNECFVRTLCPREALEDAMQARSLAAVRNTAAKAWEEKRQKQLAAARPLPGGLDSQWKRMPSDQRRVFFTHNPAGCATTSHTTCVECGVSKGMSQHWYLQDGKPMGSLCKVCKRHSGGRNSEPLCSYLSLESQSWCGNRIHKHGSWSQPLTMRQARKAGIA